MEGSCADPASGSDIDANRSACDPRRALVEVGNRPLRDLVQHTLEPSAGTSVSDGSASEGATI